MELLAKVPDDAEVDISIPYADRDHGLHQSRIKDIEQADNSTMYWYISGIKDETWAEFEGPI